MFSRSGFSFSQDDGQIRKPINGRARRPVMSKKQIDAYLTTREMLRRIQRASARAPQHQRQFR